MRLLLVPPGKDLGAKKCNSAAFVFLFPLSSVLPLSSFLAQLLRAELRMGFQPQTSQLVFGAEHLGRLPSLIQGSWLQWWLATPALSPACLTVKVSPDLDALNKR